MATAPNPKLLAAVQAKAKALEQAEHLREARSKMVMWVGLGDDVRVFRFNDTSAEHVGRLREAAGVDEARLWQELTASVMPPLNTVVLAWWMAGMQLGLTEDHDKLSAISYADGPWVQFLDDDDREAVDAGAGDLDPLDCDAG